MNTESDSYSVVPYRYAKRSMVIHCRRRPDGYKTRAMRLAEAVKARWAHRAGGYVCSPTKAKRFEALFAAGWDASNFDGTLYPPREPAPTETRNVSLATGA